MFQIQQIAFGTQVAYELINTNTGEKACIIASFGGLLNELVLSAHGQLHSVVVGSTTEEDLLGKGLSVFEGSFLFPSPNRIKDGEYTFKGQTYHLDINEKKLNNSLHGLLFKTPFQVDKAEAFADFAQLELSYLYQSNHAGYPFEAKIEIEYRLDEFRLYCTTKVINTQLEQTLPVGFGWHPYFTTGTSLDELIITIPSQEALEIDAQMIPTGNSLPNPFFEGRKFGSTQLDTGYLVKTPANSDTAVTILEDPIKKIKLIIKQEADYTQYRYLQIYTPPHRKSIAIEPMTCAANAFNNGMGLHVLAPKAKIKAEFSVELEGIL